MEPTVAGEILETVRKHLASYGVTFTYETLEWTHDPGMWKGTLGLDGTTKLVRVVLASPMTVTALARVGLDDDYLFRASLPALIVGRHVNERSAAAIREMGIAYADTCGNAYIRFHNVLVDVRGRRPPRAEHQAEHRELAVPVPQSSNLFSTGRAQVIAALLAWQGLTKSPVREIARASGVSTGQAYSTLALLEQTGYLIDRQLRTDRTDELLDLWTAAYSRGLGRKLAVTSYISTDGIDGLRSKLLDGIDSDGFALSGESVPGIGVKRPLNLILYARDWTHRQAIQHRWRAANSTAQADVHIRRKFWTKPIQAQPAAASAPIAPWPIVYADLMTSGDNRLADVAIDWRNRHRVA